MRYKLIGASAFCLLASCKAMDKVISTSSGDTRLGDALASEVETYTPAVTDVVSSAVSAVTGNPVLGGVAAATLLGVSTFVIRKLRKERTT